MRYVLRLARGTKSILYPLLGVLWVCGLALLGPLPVVWADDTTTEYLWWHFAGQRRQSDGGVLATFNLCGADDLLFDSLEFFYTTDYLKNYHAGVGVETAHERTSWHKTALPTERTLTLYGGRYEQLELWAVARMGRRTLIAQTAINLYGESGLDKNDFTRLAASPAIPSLNLNRQRGFYAAMTGEPLTFNLRHTPARAIRVLLEGDAIAELRPENDLYRFVPPRNRRLGGKALLEYRDLIFVPETDADLTFSCCLPLYRSMRDSLDYPLGLTLLLGAMIVSLGAVFAHGRRFPWR